MHGTVRKHRHATRLTVVLAAAGAALALVASAAYANVPVVPVSHDPYTNTSAFHATEVETDTFSFGRTIVSDFQVGRFSDGGSDNIGWSTSIDGGLTWHNGFLPDTTIYSTPPGPYQRVTDPSVTFDAKHHTWMLGVLASTALSGFTGLDVFVSRSNDGVHWGNPVIVKHGTASNSYDSTWMNCDNWTASPNYGNCYFEFDDFGQGATFKMFRSTDGGLTWTQSSTPNSGVIGGKPIALPNGRVIVPIDSNPLFQVWSFVSTDGGATFTGPNTVATQQVHTPAGGIRTLDIVSATSDASGKAYVTWYDCRFRTGCAENDIVMSTSTDGITWTAPVRIPIDLTTSTVDHFLAGIDVDTTTSGATAHLALIYNYYPTASCSASTCQLDYGFISSTNGGSTWGTATPLAGPITLTWLPFTSSGYMVGDYNSVSFSQRRAQTVFMMAKMGTSSCTTGSLTSCNEFAVALKTPMPVSGGSTPAGRDRPVTTAGVQHGGLVSTH